MMLPGEVVGFEQFGEILTPISPIFSDPPCSSPKGLQLVAFQCLLDTIDERVYLTRSKPPAVHAWLNPFTIPGDIRNQRG
jgi:hypothetical protein